MKKEEKISVNRSKKTDLRRSIFKPPVLRHFYFAVGNDPKTLNDINEKLTGHVLPFLERVHSLEAMEQFLTASGATAQKYPPPAIYLAILKSERGDKVGACALLAELGGKAIGAWRTRISEVAGRLGCS